MLGVVTPENVVHEDDDSNPGGTWNPYLSQDLAAGTHLVVFGDWDGAGATFELTATAQ